MTVLTLYALFGDDAKLCLADSTADDAFVVAAIMCIIFFGVEIVLQCFAYAWYFRGFYFWVDLASTLSILTEIPAVMAESPYWRAEAAARAPRCSRRARSWAASFFDLLTFLRRSFDSGAVRTAPSPRRLDVVARHSRHPRPSESARVS